MVGSSIRFKLIFNVLRVIDITWRKAGYYFSIIGYEKLNQNSHDLRIHCKLKKLLTHQPKVVAQASVISYRTEKEKKKILRIIFRSISMDS